MCTVTPSIEIPGAPTHY